MNGDDDYQRGDVVDVVVTKHVPYGLIVQLPNGHTGWIDSDCLPENMRSLGGARTEAGIARWPAIGSVVRAAVMGPRTYASPNPSIGRWRLSAREDHFAART